MLAPSFTQGGEDEVAARVAQMATIFETAGVASAALAIYLGLKSGVRNTVLARHYSKSAARITHLGRYGAYVYKLHIVHGYALDTIPPEKQVREYLQDAASLADSLDGIADVAGQLLLDRKGYYEDVVTAELREFVKPHPRTEVAQAFTKVKGATGTLRNTCQRLKATSERVGVWTAWAEKAEREDLERLLRMLDWLPAECAKIAEELREVGAG
tara:strand:+ start:593 stop:1234 length:642 start_codon:yes stop_codon:yes gene_type:complete